MHAYRSRGQLASVDSARAWLFSIARHACQRMQRRRAGEPAHLESLQELTREPSTTVPDLPEGGEPFSAAIRGEARALVERGLAEIPEPFRMVLVLSDVAELTIGEIATALGVKEATVKTRLHRARLRLREALAAGLRQRSAAPPTHDVAVCQELLRAKLEAMDRRAPLPYSEQALCERCRVFLQTLDLGREVCAAWRLETFTAELRARLATAVGAL